MKLSVGVLPSYRRRVPALGRFFLLLAYEIQDMVFAEAPATPDSVSRNGSLSRQPIDGLDVDFEDLRYLRWSYNLIHWYAPFYDVL